MADEIKAEYSGKACRDVLAYLKGDMDKEGFVSSYKKNASKSLDYAEVIGVMMRQNITDIYDAKALGVETKEFNDLSFGQSIYVNKLVDAVYDVAYTRIPNNDLGGDGKPLSYDRQRNEGLAAERALNTLGRIGEYGLGMSALKDAYFFPRKNVPDTGMTKNVVVLDMVKDDANRCRTNNQQKAQQALMNVGVVRK